MKIKAFILDLDDTLLDTTIILDPKRLAAMVQFFVQAGKEEQEIKEKIDSLQKSYTSLNTVSEKLCKYYGYDPITTHDKIIALIDLSDFTLSEDAQSFLELVKEYKLYLVTTGTYLYQKKKLAKTNILTYCELMIDTFQENNKQVLFKKILERYHSKEIVCIGDNIRKEIRIGNELGMHTIRILKGKRKDFVPRNESENPDFTVKKLMEVIPILEKLNNE